MLDILCQTDEIVVAELAPTNRTVLVAKTPRRIKLPHTVFQIYYDFNNGRLAVNSTYVYCRNEPTKSLAGPAFACPMEPRVFFCPPQKLLLRKFKTAEDLVATWFQTPCSYELLAHGDYKFWPSVVAHDGSWQPFNTTDFRDLFDDLKNQKPHRRTIR